MLTVHAAIRALKEEFGEIRAFPLGKRIVVISTKQLALPAKLGEFEIVLQRPFKAVAREGQASGEMERSRAQRKRQEAG